MVWSHWFEQYIKKHVFIDINKRYNQRNQMILEIRQIEIIESGKFTPPPTGLACIVQRFQSLLEDLCGFCESATQKHFCF